MQTLIAWREFKNLDSIVSIVIISTTELENARLEKVLKRKCSCILLDDLLHRIFSPLTNLKVASKMKFI